MNILLLMADQLTVNALEVYGNPAAKTPNIDRLAARGTVFENCYCNSPLCVPSRTSMLTGRIPSSIGSYDNGSEFPASVPTFVHHLRLQGYRTILSGKMHFVGPDQLHGFEERLTSDIYPSSFDWTPDWSAEAGENPGTSVSRLKRSGPSTQRISEIAYDDNVQLKAIERFRALKRESDSKPFFICVSFTNPHCPYVVPQAYWDKYTDENIPLPQAAEDACVHPYNQGINLHHGIHKHRPTKAEVLNSRRAYFSMVSYVDEKVGEWVAELERAKLLDDTIIIVTSDHGDMLGEHGMWYKRTFFDAAAKVPMIVVRPSSKSQRVKQVISLVDLFPTIADLTGFSINSETLDGSSFAPLLDRNTAGAKDSALCEYCGEGAIAPFFMIRKGAFKYVLVPGFDALLFNVETNALEAENLRGTAGYEKLEREFEAQILSKWNPESIRRDVVNSQRERRMINASLRKGRGLSWDWPM